MQLYFETDSDFQNVMMIYSWTTSHTLVPISNVFFQEHGTCSKIIRFSKFLHWIITNALTFVSKEIKNYVLLEILQVISHLNYTIKLAKFAKET